MSNFAYLSLHFPHFLIYRISFFLPIILTSSYITSLSPQTLMHNITISSFSLLSTSHYLFLHTSSYITYLSLHFLIHHTSFSLLPHTSHLFLLTSSYITSLSPHFLIHHISFSFPIPFSAIHCLHPPNYAKTWQTTCIYTNIWCKHDLCTRRIYNHIIGEFYCVRLN